MKYNKIWLLCLFLCLSIIPLTGCNDKKGEPEFSQLSIICELATLECFYQNVARMEDGTDSFLLVSHKKMWIEYSGIVTIGIDASKVTTSKPDQNGLVKVSMPKAKVLDIDLDEDSIDILPHANIFASITANDMIDALGYAQDDMAKTARENESMLLQGQARAKILIERYIQNVGKALGKVYTIEWVEIE